MHFESGVSLSLPGDGQITQKRVTSLAKVKDHKYTTYSKGLRMERQFQDYIVMQSVLIKTPGQKQIELSIVALVSFCLSHTVRQRLR